MLRTIYKKSATILFVAILSLGYATLSFNTAKAALNKQMNYQGKLLSSTGSTVADGSYNVRFKLYTVSSGGSPIWTETWCKSPDAGATCDGTGTDSRVALSSGLFSTMLGTLTSLAGVDFNQTLYLGVEIGGSATTPAWDGEMTPRKILGIVPAAFESVNSATVGGVASTSLVRNDTANTITANTASSLFAINQTGSGKILDVKSGGTTVFTVLSGGITLIGTTTATANESLSIYKNGADAEALIRENSGSNEARLKLQSGSAVWETFTSAGTSDLAFRYNAAEKFHFGNNGFLGVGSTTPFAKLSVKGTAGQTAPLFQIASSSNSAYFAISNVGAVTFSSGATTTADNGFNLSAGCFAVSGTCLGGGSVTSVQASGGTTGLSFSGGPITSSGTLTLGGTLAIANGGTNAGSFTNGQPVYFNGTSLVSSSTLAVNVGGTGATTLTGLIQGNGTGPFTAITTSAGISGILSDETGSGSAVFSASPTLTGTLNLASFIASASSTITGGFTFALATGTSATTTNIFSTTASSTNLFAASETIGVSSLGTLSVTGTSALTGLATFTNGFISQASSTVTGQFVVTNGSVGIGSSSPSTTLGVAGSAYISNGFGVGGLNTAAGTALIQTAGSTLTSDTVRGLTVSATSSGTVYQVLKIANPGASDLVGGGAALLFQMNPNSAQNGTTAQIAGVTEIVTAGIRKAGLAFYTSTQTGGGLAEQMRITANGNVGIGTTSPFAKLAVQATSGQTNSVFEIASSSNATKYLSVSASGFGTTTVSGLAISGSATSTSNVGIDLSGGCFAISGTCLAAGSGTVNSGTAGQIAFYAANGTAVSATSSLFINTTTGNIGIGTTSPSSLLTVSSSDTGTVLSAGSAAAINLINANTSTNNFSNVSFRTNDTNGVSTTSSQIVGINTTHLANRVSGDLAFLTNSLGTLTEAMRITAAGNVGIGTTSPITGLANTATAITDLDGATVHTGGISWVGSGSGYIVGIQQQGASAGASRNGLLVKVQATDAATYAMRVDASGSNIFSIKANGFVGIGTTSPSSKLSISASDTGTTLTTNGTAAASVINTNTTANNFADVGFWTNDSTGLATLGSKISGVFTSHSAAAISSDLAFSTRNAGTLAEKFRITAAGNVGIGTTTPGSILSIGDTGANTINISNTATSTFGSGINLGTGCFAIAGTCVGGAGGGSGTVNSGTAGQLAFYATGGTAVSATSSIFINTTTGNIGVGTTSASTKLSVSAADAGTTLSSNSAAALSIINTSTTNNSFADLGFWTQDSAGATVLVSKISTVFANHTAGSVSDALAFATRINGTLAERARFDSIGNFVIGSTTGSRTLTVSAADSDIAPASTVSNAALGLVNTNTTNNNYSSLSFITNDANGTTTAGSKVVGIFTSHAANAISSDLGFLTMNGGTMAEKMRILANGNVGIGTTSPTVNLEVAGLTPTLRIGNTSGVANAYSSSLIFGDATTPTAIQFHWNGVANQFEFETAFNAYPILFKGSGFKVSDGTTVKFLFDTGTGNAAIGTTSATTRLSVSNSDTGTTLTSNSASALSIINTNTTANNFADLGFWTQDSLGATSLGSKISSVFTSHTSGAVASNLIFSTNNSGTLGERMRIDSTGNMGIATVTPTGVLAIEQNTEKYSLWIGNQGSTTPSLMVAGVNGNGSVGIGTTTVSTTTPLMVGSANVAANKAVAVFGSATGVCFITPSATALGCNSDARLKHNINPLSPSLTTLLALDPVTYNWNAEATGTPTHTGFIAQQVKPYVPDLVDTDMFGMYTFNYAGLTPYLISALKEMNQRINVVNAPTSTPSISITAAGNVGIGTTTPGYKLQVDGDIAAQSFVNLSSRDIKKDITYIGTSDTDQMLKDIQNIKIAQYHYTNETTNTPLHLGLIAEEAPAEVLSVTTGTTPSGVIGKIVGVDLYKLTTLTLSGVQQLSKKIESIDIRLSALEKMKGVSMTGSAGSATIVSSIGSSLSNFGLSIVNGITQIAQLAVDSFKVGTPQRPTGITVYDDTTGAPYCLKIHNGISTTTPGECTAVDLTASSTLATPMAPATISNPAFSDTSGPASTTPVNNSENAPVVTPAVVAPVSQPQSAPVTHASVAPAHSTVTSVNIDTASDVSAAVVTPPQAAPVTPAPVPTPAPAENPKPAETPSATPAATPTVAPAPAVTPAADAPASTPAPAAQSTAQADPAPSAGQ